jgi:hypothetical protein
VKGELNLQKVIVLNYLISKEDMKEIFLLILPLIKAAKGMQIIIMGPMPRYFLARCCDNAGHLTNRNGEHYIDEMIQAIRDVYSWINNTIFMRRIKGVKIFNPTHTLGFNDYDVNIDTIIELWGEDPVHPTPAPYKVLVDKLAAMVDDMLAETPSTPSRAPPSKKRAAPREPWILVANRLIPVQAPRGGTNSSSNCSRGGSIGGNASHGGSIGGNAGRGGRGSGRGGQFNCGTGHTGHFNKGRGNYAYQWTALSRLHCILQATPL